MAWILWAMGLSLLMQGCLCSIGQTDRGCMKWKQNGENVCCEACYPGNRLVRECGPNPKDLCTPCEPKTFTVQPKSFRCFQCTQCIGVQVVEKECTATSDTKCGCEDGLLCGNDQCSFCIKKCGKGQEPTDKRSCRECPNGTFNDKIHQKCKPWSTRCPNPKEVPVAHGDKFTDITCANVTVATMSLPKKPDNTEQTWPVVLSALTGTVLMTFTIIIILVTMKTKKTKKTIKTESTGEETGTLTDEPRPLIAVEYSFHEAQQEQGSSTESLASKDSSKQLIG
uniref:tumor necrosis factor receptor superfamily member 9a n=1 Tax=Scatophagus argus TaxID=75038 RepID=UPI001ED85F6C|nr:tumor necrosis factor receptor superfamily member 9a [Scatophagus argus]